MAQVMSDSSLLMQAAFFQLWGAQLESGRWRGVMEGAVAALARVQYIFVHS